MAFFNVLLDTNVFINAKYDFNSSSLHNLRKYCDDGIACMITNDIITREVLHHIEVEVGLLASQAKNAIKNHSELVNALTLPVFDSIKATLLDAPKQLSTAYTSYIEGAIFLPNDGLSVVDLFNDYFTAVSPFEGRKEKKSEFPDAAIIMSIKRYISSNDHASLYVVTNDNGWHSALKNTSGIFLYKDLKSLLTEISKEQEELYKQIVSFVGGQIASLKERAEDWLLDQDWDSAIDEIEMCVECDEVDEVNVENIDLILEAIEYIDNKEEYAVAVLSGVAKIKVCFSYIDHTEEIYDREDHAWYNTVYGDGISEIAVPLSLSVSVILPDESNNVFDLDAPDFEELDRDAIVTIGYELIEQNENLCEPYYDVCPDCGQKIGLHNDGGNGFCIDCASNH